MAGLLQNAGQSLNNAQVKQLKQGYQMALQMIYDKRVFDAMMQDLKQLPPEQGLAQAIVGVMMKVQEQTGQLDMLVATSLGIALLGEVADALTQIGIQAGEEQQTTAFEIAVQLWLTANSGQYPKEDVMAALQQMGGQQQAEQVAQQPTQQAPMPAGGA